LQVPVPPGCGSARGLLAAFADAFSESSHRTMSMPAATIGSSGSGGESRDAQRTYRLSCAPCGPPSRRAQPEWISTPAPRCPFPALVYPIFVDL
jgi:hypothetical protein